MQETLDVSNEVAAELAGVGDGVLDSLRELLAADLLDTDVHRREAPVVRRVEVDPRLRLEDQLLLVRVDAHGEAPAVPLACLPREALPAHEVARPAAGALGELRLRERERELVDESPIGHAI